MSASINALKFRAEGIYLAAQLATRLIMRLIITTKRINRNA
ncbi:hypothetical protein HMPREF1582_01476 [Gardnerella vaginalis JCP8151A]|nr:hypothetical protein HMPREF1586_01348 [Gardnerella vaginalis JCP8522]EPI45006.1 hypothetical protein HMPREF1582_01476 [Gardnerella vaginalis JCP8151A]